jgi:hypothetical protein
MANRSLRLIAVENDRCDINEHMAVDPVLASLNGKLPIVFPSTIILLAAYLSTYLASIVGHPRIFIFLFFPASWRLILGYLIAYVVFDRLVALAHLR